MKSIKKRISLTGLRSRLVLLLLVGLLPVFGLVFYTSLTSEDASLADAREDLLATANLAALSQAKTIEGARQLLDAIVSTPAVRNRDVAGCMDYFQRLHGKLPGYANLGVLDLDGKLSCHALGTAASLYVGDRRYFKEALASKAFSIGEYIVGRTTGRASISFGMPVLDDRGDTTGIAFAALDLEKTIAGHHMQVPLHLDLIVMDRNGTIVWTAEPQAALLGTKVGDTVLHDAIKTRPTQAFDGIDPKGVARIYAAVAVGGDTPSGLYVVASVPRDAITSPAQRQLALSVTLLIVLAALGVMIARWMGDNIFLAPIRRLLQQVNDIAGVDAQSQVSPVRSANKLVELSRAFHRMAEILKVREQERDRIELALRQTQGRLLTAQRIGKIGNWEFDIAANHVWWSDQTWEIFGLTPGPTDLSALTYEDVLAQVFPQDRERFEAAQKIFFAGIGTLDIEHRIVRPNGEVRWVHGLGECVVDADGKPIRLSGTVQDITERRLSDEASREIEAQLRLLTDVMPQIVWMTQPDGSVTYFNQRWLDYSGLSMEESLGQGWSRLICPDDSLRVFSLWEQALTSGETSEIEYRLRRADGVYRWMLGRARPLCDATGQRTHWLGTLTDIDDLKQATAQLEKSHSMQRIAGRVARLGGWTIELPERKLTWSDENCLIHDVAPGYQPTLEEGIGYFLPEHQAIVSRHVQACAQHGTPYDFVLPKLTAKGRRIWVRSIGEALRDAAGKIIRLQGAFQDISEQKAAEARTLALEAQLVTTLESITDGFYLIDKDWKFTFINGQAERMLQCRREDLLGRNAWQLFPDAVGTRIEREFRLAVDEQRTTRFEDFYPPLNTWFDFHAYPTEAGLAVYFQDITQRRAEQAQLRLLESAVPRLNDIVIITEAEPLDEPGPRIVFVNEAFERRTGYLRKDVLGKSPRFLQGPKTQRAELDRIRAGLSKWQPVRSELVNYTKAGEEFWLELDIVPLANESGRFTHWVSVGRDITQRRQQQQEILSLNSELEARVQRRTVQLAEANKQLASFSYSVSHDLRSPLNTIAGFSQLLAHSDGNNFSEKGKHYLSRIRAGAKQMSDLIEGLLSLAHLSREQIRSEQVDLSAIARRIEQDLREREPERQVQVHIQDGLSAHGDPRLLAAVLQNLLGNAWKFSSRKMSAQIDVGSELGAEGDTFFFVRDNGAGFDMAFVNKLFGTFERLHSLEDFAGTGIGLATVKRVIERHGGRVWADGKLNEGATFYFTVGRTTSAQTEGSSPPDA